LNCCSNPQCRGIEQIFDDTIAVRDLQEYKQKGVKKTTRLLLNAIESLGVENASLLDIGGGIGAIQLELLQAGVGRVTNVDASPAYSKTACDEAARRGWGDQVDYHVGNFVDLAPTLESAEIVTLDRVICCYNEMPALVRASVARAQRVYGVVLPRDVWWIKVGIGLFNGVQRLLRHPFRIFAHSTKEMEALVLARGFQRVFVNRGIFWQVRVYAKG
jgi:magnesium-protoporphyrin O-methyltransferase